MVVAGLGIAGVGYLLYLLLPIMISLASNVLYLILMLFGIGILGYILTSKKFWNTFKVAYFVVMRRITGFFINIDPIAILEEHIRDLKARADAMVNSINQVEGLKQKNIRRLEEVKDKIKTTRIEIKKYQEMGKKEFAEQKASLLVLYERSKIEREKRLENSEKWLAALRKLQQYAVISVDTNTEKVKLFKEEYEELKAQGKAFRSIKSAINGDPDMMENLERAVEIMETEMSMDLGEIESMINETTGIINQADMENAVMSEKAQAILDKYDREEGVFNKEHWEALPAAEGDAQPIVKRLSPEERKKTKYFD